MLESTTAQSSGNQRRKKKKESENEKEKKMELSLDLSLADFPKTIGEFLEEVSRIRDGSQKLSKLDDYVRRLEEEMRKIEAFKRELPLSMLLLKDAVARLKEEAMRCNEINERALIQKILPSKRNSDEDERVKLGLDASDKKNWMSSVQLWNNNNINSDRQKQDSKSESKQRSDEADDRSTCENPIQFCHYRNKGGSFVPFKQLPRFEGNGRKEEKEVVSQATGLSLMPPISEEGSRNLLPKANVSKQIRVQGLLQQQQGSKKQRRCWSPELHQRFVDALGRLGGPQVATPKQIREHMQEDGLTNDEVKSHLQKYRLHIRKLPTTSPAAQPDGLWTAQGHSELGTSWSSSPIEPPHADESAKSTSSSEAISMEV